jgi:hypothetical protein
LYGIWHFSFIFQFCKVNYSFTLTTLGYNQFIVSNS